MTENGGSTAAAESETCIIMLNHRLIGLRRLRGFFDWDTRQIHDPIAGG
jgi:hypothetical protein